MPRTSCSAVKAARVAAVGGLNRFGPGLSGYRSNGPYTWAAVSQLPGGRTQCGAETFDRNCGNSGIEVPTRSLIPLVLCVELRRVVWLKPRHGEANAWSESGASGVSAFGVGRIPTMGTIPALRMSVKRCVSLTGLSTRSSVDHQGEQFIVESGVLSKSASQC